MVTREEAIARGYSEERDHRCLSDEALEKFLLGGTHRIFIELVKKYPKELALCFRGNSGDGDEVTIYYNNHAAFNIDRNGNLKDFDFNHARYLEQWREQMQLLETAGYVFKRQEPVEITGKDGRKQYIIGTISMPAEKVRQLAIPSDRLETLYKDSIKPIIVSYFEAKEKKEYDRFRQAIITQEKRVARQNLIEKIVQQKLFYACKSLEKGYYFYDLEFSQPHAKALECEN